MYVCHFHQIVDDYKQEIDETKRVLFCNQRQNAYSTVNSVICVLSVNNLFLNY